MAWEWPGNKALILALVMHAKISDRELGLCNTVWHLVTLCKYIKMPLSISWSVQ